MNLGGIPSESCLDRRRDAGEQKLSLALVRGESRSGHTKSLVGGRFVVKRKLLTVRSACVYAGVDELKSALHPRRLDG